MCKAKWMRAKFRSFKTHTRHKQVENTGLNSKILRFSHFQGKEKLFQALKTDILP